MKVYLLSAGNAPRDALSTILSAHACGAAPAVSGFEILHLSPNASGIHDLEGFAGDLSLCGSAFAGEDAFPLAGFSCRVRLMAPELPSAADLSADPASGLLLSALRGKGVPLSYRADREAVSWAFSSLLMQEESGVCAPFFSFLSEAAQDAGEGQSPRVSMLADLCDPWSAGMVLACLPEIRRRLPDACISLICLARSGAGASDAALSEIRGTLLDLERSGLLRRREDALPCAGADAAWILSLPAAFAAGSRDAWMLPELAAARVLGSIYTREQPPAFGLHTLQLPGTLTLSALGDQAAPAAAFLRAAAWYLCDLGPSLQSSQDHPASVTSLAPGSRGAFFRRLLRSGTVSPELTQALTRVLKGILSRFCLLLKGIPASLRLSEEQGALWQSAVAACGRTVTVASEYRVSRREVEESGLAEKLPVHRSSLADTEEEHMLRRLWQMEKQLEDEKRKKAEALSSLDASRAFQVRVDCLRRCVTALSAAESRMRAMPADTPEQRQQIARQERRVRLLRAAVGFCREDLRSLPSASAGASVSVLPQSGDGLILPAEVLDALSARILADESSAEESSRVLRERLPAFLTGYALADVRGLFRDLNRTWANDKGRDPLVTLLSAANRVCLAEMGLVRLQNPEIMPDVPLLPVLGENLSPASVEELAALIPEAPGETGEDELRGLAALLLLRQYRRRLTGEAAMVSDTLTPEDSPLLKVWLNAHRSGSVTLFSLEGSGGKVPLALILPGRMPLPARRSAAWKEALPAFVLWTDQEKTRLTNPLPFLSEGDRTVLTEQLTRTLEALPENAEDALRSFLSSFLKDLAALSAAPEEDDPAAFETRLKAACGLRLLPAYQGSLIRSVAGYEHFHSVDAVCAALSGVKNLQASTCSVREDVLYTYRNIPFARESARSLLSPVHAAEEGYILGVLSAESAMLFPSSDDYRDALSAELRALIGRFPEADSGPLAAARALQAEAASPVRETVTELNWPWDPLSPSVRTLMAECLSASLTEAALEPFSDLMTLFPARAGDVLGDSLLSAMCVVEAAPGGDENAQIRSDAFLPPLSPAFASALCLTPEGRTLLRSGFLSVRRAESDGAFRAEILLEGGYSLRLVRVYKAEEVVSLYSHDMPTLAVWPAAPLKPEAWHAYYIYASLPDSFSVSVTPASGRNPFPLEGEALRRTASCASFPVCFSLSRGGQSMGAMPNLLPAPETESRGPVTAHVDFGSSGTSVVFSDRQRRYPLHGPSLVRSLLINPAATHDLLRREFLPAVPVSALLPTVSRLFRNVPGTSPAPFEDGIILMSSDMRDVAELPPDALYTSLKWEEEKGRSGALCLHQVLLLTALQARMDGASALSFRFAVPDEMAQHGRESLARLFLSVSDAVLKESGYADAPGGEPVTFAPESAAFGAYFRSCSPDQTRGGFMTLDLGACTADLALFLRSREQAVCTCQIPMGTHYILLPTLLRDPSMLQRELAFVPDPDLQQDLEILTRLLRKAPSGPAALRHLRLALDAFIADHFSVLTGALSQRACSGDPGSLSSVLLLHFSFLLMLSGLMLLHMSGDPARNDLLPDRMSLCIGGRGSALMEALPDALKTGLWHFLTMFRNRHVSALSLLFSSEKKMEIAAGLSMLQQLDTTLPSPAPVPSVLPVRPEALLPEFLLRFRKEFPASADQLLPGFYTGDFYHPLTPYGESVLSASMEMSFTDPDLRRPWDTLCAWLGNLLELIHESASRAEGGESLWNP